MTSADLLIDAFGRIRDAVHQAADGLTPEQLAFRIDGEANTIAWLVWHLTRVQDHGLADAAESDQVWTSDGWAERFALPIHPAATGYGHRPAEVAAVQVKSADLLTGYYDAVHEKTVRYVTGVSDADLDRVVDTRWDPPVTLGVRLVSLVSDDLEHAGQAAFIRGIVERRSDG
jgi:uncharacterized damage-inducible protein DinB